MDIKNLSKANTAKLKLDNVKGALAELRLLKPIEIRIGDFKMPAVRERVAPSLEEVLAEMLRDTVTELRGLGVEVD